MKMMSISSIVSDSATSVIFRTWAVKLVALFIMSFVAMGTTHAQGQTDWVGNKQLVDRQVAMNRLKTESQRIIDEQKQSEFRAVSGETAETRFYGRIGEMIVTNNRATRDAVNDAANQMVAEGKGHAEISGLVKKAVNLLKI